MIKAKIFLLVAIIAIGVVSCEKENVKSEQNLSTDPAITHQEIVVRFYFTWDEWGRKNRNCNKAGLCRFRLEEIRIEVNCVSIFSEEDGDLYVQIPVDELIEFEDEQKNFYIDEDLYAEGPDGFTYTVPSGVYEYNPYLFEQGGFELPLIKVE